MQPLPLPPPPATADARARYNRRWSGGLLLLNAVLLCWLTMGESSEAYFERYAFWLLPALPAALAALAGGVALSLPKELRMPFYVLGILGVVLAVPMGLLAFYLAHFMGGKW